MAIVTPIAQFSFTIKILKRLFVVKTKEDNFFYSIQEKKFVKHRHLWHLSHKNIPEDLEY